MISNKKIIHNNWLIVLGLFALVPIGGWIMKYTYGTVWEMIGLGIMLFGIIIGLLMFSITSEEHLVKKQHDQD